MIFTGKYYKGGELAGRGLFNAVVPSADVFGKAFELAERIAEKPRYVLELLKDTLAMPKRLALRDAASREPMMHKICFDHPDIAATLTETYLA
jgi:polyketide biosynthesis enoyl-CoA hydratase PksI